MKKNKVLNIFILLICLLVPSTFVACENTNKDTLSTPLIVDVKAGTIVFNQVSDADYYTISINNAELNVYVKHNSNVEIIDNLINYNASKIFVIGDSYSIKIRANSSSKVSSEFSQVVSYKHMGSIKTPTNVKISSTTLTWGAVENASYYLVKIVTPNDKNIVDKDGNSLSLDDPASIAKADLTEYSFNSNRFDFASLLSTAGNYQFYVSAVLANGSTYVESGYSSKISYYNYVNLSTPINGQIKKVDSDLHLTMAVDSNANALSIVCNGIEKTTEINDAEQSITKINNNGLEVQNYLDINLNQFFQNSVALNSEQLTISTQAKYLAANSEFDFFNDSAYSSNIVFNDSIKLNAPVVEVIGQGNNNLISWSYDSLDNISGFKLFVFTTTGTETFNLLPNVTSMLITKEFIAASVQAVGKGCYISSDLSNFVNPSDVTSQLGSSNIETSGNLISWTGIDDAKYVLELNNMVYFLDVNEFEVFQNMIGSREFEIKLHTIKNGYKPATTTYNATLNSRLATPTFSASQGFNTSTLYELTFTGSSNAIGYYVYIKSESAEDYMQIDKLFTSTRINLAKYITSTGEYTNYSVKVQAVADYYGLFLNSEKSAAVQVTHAQILEAPSFHETHKIVKETSGNTTKYFLQFYGVEGAEIYEILVNFNRISVEQKPTDPTGLYKIDITPFLSAANNYEIKIRAIAPAGLNVKDSEYSSTTYTLTKQLSTVENIHVTENDGVYSLSFDPIENAENYRVRIVKENDNSYNDYLNALGLSSSFEVSHAVDVSQFVKQAGVYYFYVTALAPKNSYYADANESSSYGIINKLTTLEKPKDIIFNNISDTEYLLSWTGDSNADYYLIKIVDPNKISNEFKVYNSTSTNINKHISVQGTYDVSIYSMVDSVGENAKTFTSSSASNITEYYTYQLKHDFLRHNITMFGETLSFVVENVQDLKNLLWYHYLYEINENIGLNIYIEPQPIVQEGVTPEEETTETLRQSIIRFAEEASNSPLYNYSEKLNFGEDEVWLSLINNQSSSDSDLISYLGKKLLLAYPEFNVLVEDRFAVDHSDGSNIFNFKYKNLLNQEKTDYTEQNIFSNKNYGNDYSYIDLHSRRSVNSPFKIDSNNSMLVTTTEQLLHTVENGYKPLFVGNSETAEIVYSNAKLVLSAIITNNMTDLEKTTAIFDWLEYGFDLTYYKDSSLKTRLSNSFELSNLSEYGLYKHYYLEGIFEDISMNNNGELIIGNNLATSQSYSKAFSLLCAIEGIEAVTVNGSYTYRDLTNGGELTTNNHVWNKVRLDTSISQTDGKKWYAVDLTYSDNKINFNNLNNGYGISSHTYFLVSDSVCETNLNLSEESYLISKDYYESHICETTYNHNSNSSFALSYNQIKETIPENLFAIYGTQYTCNKCSHEIIAATPPAVCTHCQEESTFTQSSVLLTSGFRYSKEYNSDENYQHYKQTSAGYGKPQDFWLNTIIYASYMANQNKSNVSVFEFNFKWSNNNGQPFNQETMFEDVFTDAKDLYFLKADLVGSLYKVNNNDTRSTTVIFIVKKTA